MSHRLCPAVLRLVALALLLPSPARADWKRAVKAIAPVRVVAVNSTFGVFAAPSFPVTKAKQFGVSRLTRCQGAPVWGSRSKGATTALAPTPDGGIVIAGPASVRKRKGQAFSIVCRAASNGAQIWRYDAVGETLFPAASLPTPIAGDIAVGGDGTVYAAAELPRGGAHATMVVRIDGMDGTADWQRLLGDGDDGLRTPVAVEVAPSGRLVVATHDGDADALEVAAMSVTSGADAWRVTLAGVIGNVGMAVMSGGDVLVAATSAGGAFVTRLDADSGAEVWRRSVLTGAPVDAGTLVSAFDSGGTSAVAAQAADGSGARVAALDADGTSRWERAIAPQGGTRTVVDAMAFGAGSDVGVTGYELDAAGASRLLALRIDGDAGTDVARHQGDADTAGHDVYLAHGGGLIIAGERRGRFFATAFDDTDCE